MGIPIILLSMRLISCLLLPFGLFFPLCGESLQFSIGAESAILMNAKTGKVLFEKNAQVQCFPASTTKIATAIVALQKVKDLEQIFIADRESVASISPQAKKQSLYRSPSHWIETDSTHIGIKCGEEFRFYDLLYGILVASANDASNVVARNLAQSIPEFMDEVNRTLKQIGCQETHYNNPHGLHHPEHVTTAYDLALMTKFALQEPIFRKIVSTVRYTCPQTNLVEERNLIQTNYLLRERGPHYYNKAIGGKTGYTSAAGKNLVAVAQSGDRELIAVAMGYRGPRSELYTDVIKMFEGAFNEKKMRRILLPQGEQKLTTHIPGAKKKIKAYLAEPLTYDYYPSEEIPIKLAAFWSIPQLPISQNAPIGMVKIMDDKGETLQEISLLALENIQPKLWYRLIHIKSNPLLFAMALPAVFLLFFFFMKRR